MVILLKKKKRKRKESKRNQILLQNAMLPRIQPKKRVLTQGKIQRRIKDKLELRLINQKEDLSQMEQKRINLKKKIASHKRRREINLEVKPAKVEVNQDQVQRVLRKEGDQKVRQEDQVILKNLVQKARKEAVLKERKMNLLEGVNQILTKKVKQKEEDLLVQVKAARKDLKVKATAKERRSQK